MIMGGGLLLSATTAARAQASAPSACMQLDPNGPAAAALGCPAVTAPLDSFDLARPDSDPRYAPPRAPAPSHAGSRSAHAADAPTYRHLGTPHHRPYVHTARQASPTRAHHAYGGHARGGFGHAAHSGGS